MFLIDKLRGNQNMCEHLCEFRRYNSSSRVDVRVATICTRIISAGFGDISLMQDR